MTHRSTDLSIVIPMYGGAEFTRSCLDSLRRHPPGVAHEIVLVDDCSPDEASGRFLAQLETDEGIRLVRRSENGGFAKACNHGIQQSRGGLVLLLNNDTEALEGWYPPLARAMEDPRVGVAGSLLLYPKTGLIQHCGVEFVRTRTTLRSIHRGQFWQVSRFPEACGERDVPAVTGACMLIRREAVENGRFLDESYQNGYEDLDLCLRLGSRGWKIRYCGASRMIHHESVSAGRFDSENPNRNRFLAAWGGMTSTLPGREGILALRDLRARRDFLGAPTPWKARRVLRWLGDMDPRLPGLGEEIELWKPLARGAFLPWRRLPAGEFEQARQKLGFGGIRIRLPKDSARGRAST